MKKVHFIGIAGSGASAAAAIAKSNGFEVSGCDKNINNEFVKNLKNIQIYKGHSPNHLYGLPTGATRIVEKGPGIKSGPNVDIVTVSPAVSKFDPNNPELLEAINRGKEVLTWQQFMGKYLQKDKFVIAVSGTHGKSTTTAMVGQILEDAGLDPTVELGAIVPKWGKNYRVGQGKYFVTEADEYNNNFLATFADINVVTNLEEDHLEFFKNLEGIKSSFVKFLLQTKGAVVANIQDENVAEVLKWVMKDSKVEVLDYTKSDFMLNLKIPGKHNLQNANAAFEVGLLLGIDPQTIKQSLNNFSGIGRRFEMLGEINGAKIYSDFGHHPTEIKSTIEAARSIYPDKKITLIFQPHLFSRTKLLLDEFIKAFQKLPVEKTYILDIYPSREKDTGEISSQILVGQINKNNISYEPLWQNLKTGLLKSATSQDIIIFMGAGDTDIWAKELLNKNEK